MNDKNYRMKKFIYRVLDTLLLSEEWPLIGLINVKMRIFFARKISKKIDKKIGLCKGCRISENTELKRNVYVGKNVVIQPCVSIGDNTMIGNDCKFLTSNHHRDENGVVQMYIIDEPRPIIVEKNVWIGTSSIIMGGGYYKRRINSCCWFSSHKGCFGVLLGGREPSRYQKEISIN